MSRRLWASLGIAILASCILAACGLSGPAYREGPATADAVVVMTTGLNFDPDSVTVPVGGTVEWRNKSLFSHTVDSDSVPAGAAPFSSGDIPQGGVYRHTFSAPGVYHYHCRPHQGLGMTGQITVVGGRT